MPPACGTAGPKYLTRCREQICPQQRGKAIIPGNLPADVRPDSTHASPLNWQFAQHTT
jgi:hypothetical protein